MRPKGVIQKDTIIVPTGGYVAVRVKADNPGESRRLPEKPNFYNALPSDRLSLRQEQKKQVVRNPKYGPYIIT